MNTQKEGPAWVEHATSGFTGPFFANELQSYALPLSYSPVVGSFYIAVASTVGAFPLAAGRVHCQ